MTQHAAERDAMGRMKDLHITIHNGGDEAVAAVERMGKDWREQLEQAASEIERLRLTDAEREAIKEACDEGRWYPKDYHHIHTLRALLERTTL
jgi:type IV pilus biogenesis protein CpaD/CtpE